MSEFTFGTATDWDGLMAISVYVKEHMTDAVIPIGMYFDEMGIRPEYKLLKREITKDLTKGWNFINIEDCFERVNMREWTSRVSSIPSQDLMNTVISSETLKVKPKILIAEYDKSGNKVWEHPDIKLDASFYVSDYSKIEGNIKIYMTE